MNLFCSFPLGASVLGKQCFKMKPTSTAIFFKFSRNQLLSWCPPLWKMKLIIQIMYHVIFTALQTIHSETFCSNYFLAISRTNRLCKIMVLACFDRNQTKTEFPPWKQNVSLWVVWILCIHVCPLSISKCNDTLPLEEMLVCFPDTLLWLN